MSSSVTPLTPLTLAALALLAERPMHPYEMYQLSMQRRDHRLVKIKPGTLYHAVRRLAESGLVAVVSTEREGNRPERTTYEITDAGRDQLQSSVALMLAQVARGVPGVPLRPRRGPQPARGGGHPPADHPTVRPPRDDRRDRGRHRRRPAGRTCPGLTGSSSSTCTRSSALRPPGSRAPSPTSEPAASPSPQPSSRSREKQPRERDSLQAVAGPVGPGHRLLHDLGRLDHRVRRQPGHPARPGRRHHVGHLGDQRLPAGVRRPTADHRPAR